MIHDQVDIDTIYEQHYEQFCGRVGESIDLENAIAVNFLEGPMFYKFCKEDHYLEDSTVEDAFDTLYAFDAEGLVENPLDCVESYADYQKQMRDAERSYKAYKHLFDTGVVKESPMDHVQNCAGCDHCK